MEELKSLKMKKKFQELLVNENFEKIELSVNRKNLSFAMLKIKNNSFDEKSLKEYLEDAVIYYALPKKRIKELMDEGKLMSLANESKGKLKNYKVNEGEGGELISYCINESVLNAPKLLSKLKLKTNKEDYVKGADGIHLIKVDDSNFELLICESKMYKDLGSAIANAFNSIKRFENGGQLEFELTSLATNFDGEFADQETIDYISKVIIPSREGLTCHIAYSIFIGFEINDIDKSIDYNEYILRIKIEVENTINEHIKEIEKKIGDENMRAHTFYIFLMPFFNIQKIRKEIIQNIEGRDFDD